MGRNEDVHDLLQKLFSGRMIRKQSVSVHVVEIARVGVWESLLQPVNFFCAIKAEQFIEPLLNMIVVSIPDWLIQRHFL